MLGFYGVKGGEGVGSALGRVESGGLARLDSGQVAPDPVGPRWAGLAPGRAAPGRVGLVDSLVSCPRRGNVWPAAN